MSTPSEWKHFTIEELTCRCGCGKMEMNPDFMERVEMARLLFDHPMVVTSAYRCASHNLAISNTGPNGPHVRGLAMDFTVFGQKALAFVQLASKMFSGLFVHQHGEFSRRFFHIDNMPVDPPAAGFPRPWLGSYP